jgi:hypothetical protein
MCVFFSVKRSVLRKAPCHHHAASVFLRLPGYLAIKEPEELPHPTLRILKRRSQPSGEQDIGLNGLRKIKKTPATIADLRAEDLTQDLQTRQGCAC